MTKEKRKADYAMSVICILAALVFGAYLGTPGPKVWAHPVSQVISVVSEQITKMEHLHNETAKDKNDETVDKKANETNDQETKGGSGAVTQAAVEMIISEAPAEVQPDYICLNANRGGIADRKEKDVLIHLINAEAYGLSYKAKVAVGQVVMNRWTGPYYGDDLLAIMTAPYQFTPIHNGSAYKKEIEPDSIEAANAVLSGAGVKELNDNTYYFVNPDFTEDKTIEQKMKFVCEIEGIHFFEPPTK